MAALSLADVSVDTVAPHFLAARRAPGGIVLAVGGLGEGRSVQLRGDGRGFELLVGGKWVSTPIAAHGARSVTVADIAGATKLRYLWYSNPCGTGLFGCAAYVGVKPLVDGLSGEQPFLPLPPFYASL